MFNQAADCDKSSNQDSNNTARDKSNCKDKKCIFCDIVKKEADATIVCESDKFLAFSNISPASEKHFLVIPKEHIRDTNSMTSDDALLIEEMKTIGLEIMHKEGFANEQIRLGFHKAPFISVHHLHLHSIAPISSMSWLKNIVYMPKSLWFKEVDDIIAELKK